MNTVEAPVKPRGRTTRAERARMPLAKDVVREIAVEHGVCVKPLAMLAEDRATGETRMIDVPCGNTQAAVCPPCAEKAKRLRMAQCREGWHLEEEPLLDADPATPSQEELVTERADRTAERTAALAAGAPPHVVAELDQELADLDERIADAGMRGSVAPGSADRARRVRSTKRRQDVADLPRRPVEKRTLGRTFTTPDGRVLRPSMFVTVTLPSYGRVLPDGTPVDPARYDYRRAARDAIHFSRLLDRFVQNLRRVAGYEVQYFAAVESQRRLAMHAHLAIRGTLPRAEMRQIAAATYHQVWWPPADEVRYEGDRMPVWDEGLQEYIDPTTGAALPTFDDALDDLDDDDEPMHVIRCGTQLDVQGLLSGSPDVDRRIGYVTKYLTKDLDACHEAATDRQRAHLDRLTTALRYEPCSPTCANWLRYGISPRNARPHARPGYCKGKAHRRKTLGYGGRRVLVSRKWSGKTLADHKADRRAWVLDALGIADGTADDATADRYAWRPASPDDSVPPLAHRLLHAVAERARWRAALDEAKRRAAGQQPPTTTTSRQFGTTPSEGEAA